MSDEVRYGEYAENVLRGDAVREMEERYGKPAEQPEMPDAMGVDVDTSGAAPVVGDIARGITEAPGAIYSGARAALEESLQFGFEAVDPLASFLEKMVPLEGVTPEFMKKGEVPLPDVGQPTTTTGGLVKSVSQFLTGMAGAGKLKILRKWGAATKGAKFAKGSVQGALSDFAAFDPDEENLSNLIAQYPALQPLGDYMAIDKEDPALLNRARRALEGLGLGAATEGLLLSARAFRAKRLAKSLGSEVIVPETVVEASPLSPLGDPKGDLFNAYDEAGNKLDMGGKRTSDITPGMVLGREEPHLGEVGEVTGAGAAEPKIGDVDALGGKAEPKLGEAGEVTGAGAAEPTVKDMEVGGAEPKMGEKPRVKGKPATVSVKPATLDINFARINTADDIKEVMERMAKMSEKDINAERRGVRTWEQTKLSADQKDAFDILMKRRQGEGLNAEETLAARRLWVASAEKLAEVAEAAANSDDPAALFMFRKQLATHYAIQKEVIGARTETARALNAWAIPAESNEMLAKVMQNLLDSNGGHETARELAKRVAVLSKAGMAKTVEAMVEGSLLEKTKGAVKQVFVNALLTNPATHLANASSSMLTAAQAIYERKAASMIAQLTGEPGVVDGEALALAHGTILGVRDALVMAAKRTRIAKALGIDLVGGDLPAGLERGKVEAGAPRSAERARSKQAGAEGRAGGALSSSAWDVAKDTTLGKSLDFMDVASRVPGKALEFSDDIFKMIGYRAELHALAHRQAVQDVAAGLATDLRTRTAEILANPPESVRLDAVDAALYRTFNDEPAKLADKAFTGVRDMLNTVPGLGTILMPFKNAPINLMTYGFERTPLAPLVGKWRADYAAGGARQQMALAKFATGNMVLLAAMDLALQGELTGAGPQRPGERAHFQRMGRQRYSVKGPAGTWYSYNRLDPAGSLLGLAGDIVEISMSGAADEATLEEYMTASALAIGNAMTSKTYFSGIADLFEAMGDKERYGEGFFKKLAGGVVVPPGVAAARRVEDPYLRHTQDMGDAIRARTPGLSKDLPPIRDLWGRPATYGSGFGTVYDLMSPVYVKRENPEPIDTELEALDYYPTLPGRTFDFQGVPVDLTTRPEIYARYVELAGNEAKDMAWNMGAKDMLNAVVTGEHELSPVYELRKKRGTESAQQYIASVISKYRDLAKRQLMDEYPELKLEVEERRDLRLRQLEGAN